MWVTATYYNSIWDAKDLTVKLAMWLQMFGLVCMGITIDDAFEFGGTRAFGAGFIVAISPLGVTPSLLTFLFFSFTYAIRE